MRVPIPALAGLFAFSALCAAPPAQAPGEAALVAQASKKLNDYAKDCLDSGFPQRAEEVWRELLAEYDSDDATARAALGFKAVGKAWARDPEFQYPQAGTPVPAKAKALRKRWDALSGELAKLHLDLAQTLAAANQVDRANYHFDRVLRFQPGEPKAAAARGVVTADGASGTDMELAMLKRVKVIRRALGDANARQFKVQPTEQRPDALANVGAKLTAFAGPNVVCYGNIDPAILQECVRVAERSLVFTKAVLAGYAAFPGGEQVKHLVFCRDEATYDAVLNANVARFGGSAAFLREHRPGATMMSDGGLVAFMRTPTDAVAYDLAARYVAQGFAGLRCDAMVEGMGHAIVGLLLGRNLAFTIGEDKGNETVAGRARRRKLEVPDIDVWRELAVESAWESTGTAAAQLPFLQAASFPTDARIKSWSFVYFLLLRDPELIRRLDESPSDKVRTALHLRETFTARTGIHIDLLDRQWREFWTKDTPVLRVLRGGETGALESVSDDAGDWVAAISSLRTAIESAHKGLGLRAVQWSEAYSEACKLHADWLERNRSERGPGREDSIDLASDGATPELALFAAQSLTYTGALKSDKAVEQWLTWPGFRHVLLNPGLHTVGAYVAKSIVVLDVHRGVTLEQGYGFAFPFPSAQGLPHDVELVELGPEARRFLEGKGVKGKRVGYPITYHRFTPGGGLETTPGFYQCELLANGKKTVPGAIFIDEHGSKRSSGRGLVVFFPLQPLEKGASYTYRWTLGGKAEPSVTFSTAK